MNFNFVNKHIALTNLAIIIGSILLGICLSNPLTILGMFFLQRHELVDAHIEEEELPAEYDGSGKMGFTE